MTLETHGRDPMIRWSIAVVVVATLLGCLPLVHGYSVLSHEALIDASWETGIRPGLGSCTLDQTRSR
jgi:hypothetical protein